MDRNVCLGFCLRLRIGQFLAKRAPHAREGPVASSPIIREPDGLALSSRNSYLNPEERRAASALHRALGEAQCEVNLGTRDATQLQRAVQNILSSEPLVRVDYIEIVDAETFEAVSRIGVRPVYVLLAAYIGRTRLIDNLFIAPAPGLDNPLCSL